jgi:hypothetical protein
MCVSGSASVVAVPPRDDELAGLVDDIERGNIGLTAHRVEQERLLAELKDTNSAFPATQEFLKGRGLTHVNQLSKRGMRDLTAHLQGILRNLRN